MKPAARNLELVYFDAGGGHRSAAVALREVIAERHPDWRVELVNLQEVLEPVDLFHKVTGRQSQSFYNALLKRGWTFGSLQMLRALQKGIQLYSDHIEEELRKQWRSQHPDMVVSLIPNFNGVMLRALRSIHPEIPYVTIMTDLADIPPHFWQERQEQHLICGTDRAVAQALAIGYPAERVLRVSGMILKPGFYRPASEDRQAARLRLGLDPTLPTALIMFGGYGSTTAARIVERLHRSGQSLQMIVMCGHNDRLRAKLQDQPDVLAVGYTNAVPDYMRIADFFIGKPGPGSLSEALHLGLPAIVEKNLRTMPQERYNAEWLAENGLGIAIRDFRQIAGAVQQLLSDGLLEQFRANASRLNNRAVFEIPGLLARIMETSGTPQAVRTVRSA